MAQPRVLDPAWMPAGLPQNGWLPGDVSVAQWRGWGGAFGIVDQMPLTDGLVYACTAARIQGVLDLALIVSPASLQPEDREVADFIKATLRGVRGGWKAWLSNAAQFSARGAVYFEPTYRRRADDRTVLDRLLIAPLRAVERWEWGADAWDMRQFVMPSASRWTRSTVLVPADELIALRQMPEGDDPEPGGMLRSAYGAWIRRQRVWSLRTDALERGAYGIPNVTNDGTGSPADAAKAWKIAMMSRAGLYAAEQMPDGWRKTVDAWPIEVDGMASALDGDGFEIAEAFACQHLLTGKSNGTQELIRGQISMIYRPAVRTDGDIILEQLLPVVARLVELNFPGREPPILSWDPPSDDSILERVRMVMELRQNNQLADPDGALDRWTRDSLDLPELVEVAQEIRGSGEPEPPTEPEPEGSDEGDDGPSVEVEPAEPEPDDKPATAALAATDIVSPLLPGAALVRTADPAPEPVVAAPVDPSDVLARFADDCLIAGPGGRPVALAERSIRASETVVPLRGLQRRAADALVAWTASIADAFGAAVAEQAERWPDGDAVASAVLQPELEASLRGALTDLYGDAYNAGSSGARAEVRRISRNPAAVQAVVEDVRERPVAALADGGCRCGRPHGAARGFDVILAADPQQPPPPRSARGGAGTVARLNAADLIERWVSEVARDNMQRVREASARVLKSLGPGGSLRGVSFDTVRDAVREAIEALSPGETGRPAAGPVNTMFSLGRMQEQIASGADRWLYSTSIESNRCEPCIEHDLTLVGPDDLNTYSTPASWCLGGDRCNCLLIAVPADQLPADLRGAA